MTLGDFLRILRQRWGYVVGALMGLLLVAGTLTWFTEPSYESTAQVYVSTSATQGVADLVQGSNFTQRQVTTYADLVTVPQVLEPVAATLGIPGGAPALESSVRARAVPQTVLIDITAADPDPVRARDKANAVAEQFTELVEELESGGRSDESPVVANVVRPARASAAPASPNVERNLLVAVLLGLVLGPVLALAREILDTRLRDESDVGAVTDATILGRIGVDRDSPEALLQDTDPHSPRAEAFRKVRTNLQFIEAAQRHGSFLITSSLPREGKTTTTLSVARVLAEAGSSVCVVDADLRRPHVLDAVGLEGAVGLTNILIGELTVSDVAQTWMGRVTMIGAGPIPPNPSELLGSAGMGSLLEELQQDHDYVLVDSPPLLPVTDAAVLAGLTGGVVVVVGCGTIDRDHLRASLDYLAHVEATLVGLVLNRVPSSASTPYGYGYGYGYAPATKTSARRRGRIPFKAPGRLSGKLPGRAPQTAQDTTDYAASTGRQTRP